MGSPGRTFREGLEEAKESRKKAEERLARAEENLQMSLRDLRDWREANKPLDVTNPNYLALEKEANACRETFSICSRTLSESIKCLEVALMELGKVQAAKDSRLPVISLTDFPLSPPSQHPSQSSMTEDEKVEEKRLKEFVKKQKREENAVLKRKAISFYYGGNYNHQARGRKIADMLTGFEFPVHEVHRAHIYQASWSDEKFEQLISNFTLAESDRGMTKDSERNMLLLHFHVESKYDSGQLLFEYVEKRKEFVCRILDESIREEIIFLQPIKKTFGEFDGKALIFPLTSRPLKELIQFRAMVNRQSALTSGFITQDVLKHLADTGELSSATKTKLNRIREWSAAIPPDSRLYVDSAPDHVKEEDNLSDDFEDIDVGYDN